MEISINSNNSLLIRATSQKSKKISCSFTQQQHKTYFMMLRNGCLFLFCVLAVTSVWANVPLDDYVYTSDPNYKYTDTGLRLNGTGWKGYLLNMTSQRWLSDQDTTCSLWWHIMAVIVPDNVTCLDCSSIWITGGENDGSLPKPTDEDIVVTAALATTTGAVSTALFQVPVLLKICKHLIVF